MTQSQQAMAVDINVVEPLLVRRHCISRYPDSKVSIHCPSRSSILEIPSKNYLWDHVPSGSIRLTVPYSICTLIEHSIGEGEGMIVELDHLLAISCEKFPRKLRAFDLSSFIDGRHIFFHVEGPAYLALFGAGEITLEKVTSPIQVKRGTIIGYSDTLTCGVGLSNTSALHAISQSHVLEDRIEGAGYVFRQTSSLSMRKIAASEAKTGNTFVDYLNAVVGVR